MRRIFSFILIALFSLASCRKDKISKDTPTCIKKIIKDQRKNLCADEGSSVAEYLFQGETVFRFDLHRGCIWPGAYVIYDSDCNTLAEFSGIGLSNDQMVNGETFSNAQFVRNVWVKE